MRDDLQFFGGIFLYLVLACLGIAGLFLLLGAMIAVSAWYGLALLLYVPLTGTAILAFGMWWADL